MGQAKVMSHLMSNGGGKAYQVMMVILEEKYRTLALYSAEYIIKYQYALFISSCDHTWLTPPEFSVHIANLFASPTVSVSKSFPLVKKKNLTLGQTGSITVFNICTDFQDWSSRHKLGIVMLLPLQKISLAPHKEIVQSFLWIEVNVNVVSVRPDLQPHQHDANVQSSIELQAEEETFFRNECAGTCQLQAPMAHCQGHSFQNMSLNWKHKNYLVDVIYNSKNTGFCLTSILFILEEKQRQTLSEFCSNGTKAVK